MPGILSRLLRARSSVLFIDSLLPFLGVEDVLAVSATSRLFLSNFRPSLRIAVIRGRRCLLKFIQMVTSGAFPRLQILVYTDVGIHSSHHLLAADVKRLAALLTGAPLPSASSFSPIQSGPLRRASSMGGADAAGMVMGTITNRIFKASSTSAVTPLPPSSTTTTITTPAEYCLKNLESLRIQASSIGFEGLKEVFKALNQHTKLRTLTLDGTPYKHHTESIHILAQSLSRGMIQLHKLSMNNCGLTSDVLPILGQALASMASSSSTPSITKRLHHHSIGNGNGLLGLELACNPFDTYQDQKQQQQARGTSFSSSSSSTQQQGAEDMKRMLLMEEYYMGTASAYYPHEMVTSTYHPSLLTLQRLNLSGQNIGPRPSLDVIIGLCQAIAMGALPSLQSLDLWHTFLDNQAAGYLGQALASMASSSSSPPLQSLEVDVEYSEGSCGWEALAVPVIRTGRSFPCLTKLRLGQDGAEWAVCRAIGSLICNALPRLRELDLRGCNIDPMAFGALLTPFYYSGSHIKSLRLGANKIGGKGAAALAEALERGIMPTMSETMVYQEQAAGSGFGKALEELDLKDNDIDQEGGRRLAQALKNPAVAPRLTCLDLSFNQLGVEGMRACIEAIRTRERMVKEAAAPISILQRTFLYQNDVPYEELGRLRGKAWAPSLDNPTALGHHNIFL